MEQSIVAEETNVTAIEPAQLNMLLETICDEAKKGATRGYIELRLRAALAKSKWAYFLLMFRKIEDDRFLSFVYTIYLTTRGLRAPKVGRSW
jgi:hypothetical protein